VLLLGYYTDDGKFIYAGRMGSDAGQRFSPIYPRSKLEIQPEGRCALRSCNRKFVHIPQ
jgi:hypothetical protein